MVSVSFSVLTSVAPLSTWRCNLGHGLFGFSCLVDDKKRRKRVIYVIHCCAGHSPIFFTMRSVVILESDVT